MPKNPNAYVNSIAGKPIAHLPQSAIICGQWTERLKKLKSQAKRLDTSPAHRETLHLQIAILQQAIDNRDYAKPKC